MGEIFFLNTARWVWGAHIDKKLWHVHGEGGCQKGDKKY